MNLPASSPNERVMTSDVITITKRFAFEAAHQLPWHDGKCARLHGHSYVLEVTVCGAVKPDQVGVPDSGMVVDFSALKAAVNPLVNGVLDHYSLNDLMVNPTAENLIVYLAHEIAPRLPEYVTLTNLRLYETADSWVDWTNA